MKLETTLNQFSFSFLSMTFSTREQSEKQREAIIQLMLLSLIPAEKSDPREREKYQLFEVTRMKHFPR